MPRCIVIAVNHRKLLIHSLFLIRQCLFFNSAVLHCKVRHCFKWGWFLTVGFIFVKIWKLVYPHQIKAVAQLTAGRVCCVMRVCKLVIIHYYSGCGIGGDIIITTVQTAWFIHIWKECAYCVLYRICTAKCTDYSLLCQRVCLFLQCVWYNFFLSWRNRIFRSIMPIFITCKHCVRIYFFTVTVLKYKLTVRRSWRPIHKSMRLIRCIVKLFYAYICRYSACNRRIFICRNRTWQRDNKPESRGLCSMLVCGIYQAFEIKEQFNLFPKVLVCVIRIKSEQTSVNHSIFSP